MEHRPVDRGLRRPQRRDRRRLPEDARIKDQRDKEIGRVGEYAGQSFLVIGAVAALALSMAEAGHFWISNAIYLGFALSAVLASVVKIAAYRWGFQSW